jgi:hypothetical protein
VSRLKGVGDSALRFTELMPAQRVSAVLDTESFEPGAAAGALVLGRGTIDARDVYVVATAPGVARGAIGVAECRGLSVLLAQARENDAPIVLLLDSSGARVDEGLLALGAFRMLLREALRTRLARSPMLAVVGRACFGGASLLACVCGSRHYLAGARLAASGPAVIEGAMGSAQFDARNQAGVDGLMGSAARIQADPQGTLIADTPGAVRESVRTWLQELVEESWSPDGEHALQRERLSMAVVAPLPGAISSAMSARFAAVLPQGYKPQVAGDAFSALPPAKSSAAAFLGTLSGVPVGAATCWQIADWLLALHRDHPHSPVVLLLDADGHAASVADERVLLSAYLVHLSLTLAWLRAAGHRIVLWIPGRASGASYVTFAAPVDAVSALPSAQIEILPAAAVKQIVKVTHGIPADPSTYLSAGVADALLDSRLAAYADSASPRP